VLHSTAIPKKPDRSLRLFQFEAFALCAFAFVLPQFEVPKNVLWIAYVLLWLANRWRSRNFGGRWDGWDSLFAAWIASAYLSAMFAGLQNSEWKSAFDVARYGIILWLMRRSRYGEDILRTVLACLVLGTLAALVSGYCSLLFVPSPDGQPRYLGLRSVGHVNHSAIYLAIAFAAALAWVRGSWRNETAKHRSLGLAICAAFALSIFVMQSRATVGVALLVGFFLLAVYAFRSGKRLWKVLAGAILIVTALMITKPEVVEKNSLRMKEANLFAFRDRIWRTGVEAWRQFPAFGVGMGNFGRISLARMEQWSKERGDQFDGSRVLPQAHAHSLFINTAAERGTVGLTVLIAVLAAWIVSLARAVPATSDSAVRWAYWGGALGAWLVAVLVGLVNTTMHHEHALISVMLLGGWLALARAPRQAQTGHA
jgi:O-antigen ligase